MTTFIQLCALVASLLAVATLWRYSQPARSVAARLPGRFVVAALFLLVMGLILLRRWGAVPPWSDDLALTAAMMALILVRHREAKRKPLA